MTDRPRLRRASSGPQRGITLLELIIAIGLIALLTGALLLGTAFRGKNERRAAATLIVAGVRMAITRANTTGRPVRMVFDLDQQRLLLEESESGQMLRVKQDGKLGKEDDPAAGAAPVTELERKAREAAERLVKGPQAARSTFTPVQEFGADGDDPTAGRWLGTRVKIRQVQTEHDAEPRTEGRAYLYFWPRAGTEEAAIQLVAGEGDDGITVRVSALTGRARIESGRVGLPEPRDEVGYTEREEE